MNPAHALTGIPCTGADTAAHTLYTSALRAFQCCQGDPVNLITPTLEQHPEFAMGRLLHGWLHALSTEPSAREVILQDTFTLSSMNLNRLEHMHLQALQAFQDGHWQEAGRRLSALSQEWPRDALALQAGHYIDFLCGDSQQLRDRIASALPAWSDADPGAHALWGMWAFGLEECGEYEKAEQAGLKALALEPADAWAHHAVAHVYEMQGRSAEGLRWMQSREPHWNDHHFLAVHNAWHWALFHLKLGQMEDALGLYDKRIWGQRSGTMVDLVDASAMLWRLELMGVDVGTRWEALADDWQASAVPGHYVFNDFHAMLAWVASGRETQAKAWLQAQHEPVVGGDVARLALDVGVPLLSALWLRTQGHPESVMDELTTVRPNAIRMGGSHAQRDLIDLLMIDTAVRHADHRTATALIDQRQGRRPPDHIQQHLLERVADMLDSKNNDNVSVTQPD